MKLEKRFGGSIPGGSRRVLDKILLPIGTKPISPYIYSFSRTRQESSHQTFSQDALFGLFGGQKAQIGLHKTTKLDPSTQNLLIETCRKSVINNLGLVARFSQDVQFELFGRQKTQIGCLEKIKEQNCGSFAVGDWNRVRAIPGLTVHLLVSFAFNGFYCRKLVSNSLLTQKDFSMAGFDIKKTN